MTSEGTNTPKFSKSDLILIGYSGLLANMDNFHQQAQERSQVVMMSKEGHEKYNKLHKDIQDAIEHLKVGINVPPNLKLNNLEKRFNTLFYEQEAENLDNS